MIPVVFLGIQPHHRVLDLCASPGSKTTQVLDALHPDGGGHAAGFLVANDADARRAYILVSEPKMELA
jgi:16S rRNA C967 or C1407 C5-methylase (RsmB/RsmF family)